MKKYLLLIIVFLTGAAVLVIEIAATRILSVYFGNTIYTVSSVISVILLALSLGYFIGGRLADKRASELLFYEIIAFSGVSIFLLQLLNLLVLPSLSKSFSLQEGPLVSAILLFLLPGFLLGMLSPLVVKLQKMRLESVGIGQVAGDVFFWSTLGSIVGSLATGFYLIPQFGVMEIIVGVGILLVIIGVAGIMHTMPRVKKHVVVLLLLIPLLQIGVLFVSEYAFKNGTVYATDGVYDSIVIYDGEFNGKKTRFLQQATDASSAMYLDSPDLVYDYTKYYALYKAVNPDISHALVIGGGAYSVPKALLRDDTDVVVDVSEIEPELFALVKQYFNVPTTPRLVNHVEDGRRFLQTTPTKYDVIFTDAFHFSIPSHLTTKEFFMLSKEKLAPEGMYIMNIIGSLSPKTPSFAFSMMKTFQSVYPNSYFFAVNSVTTQFPQNIMMVGYNSEKQLDFTSRDPLFAYEHVIDLQKYDLEHHPRFTDNYAPAEYFIMRDQFLR